MIDKVQYPTVGRIVHYHHHESVAPFAAIVTLAIENRYTIPVLTAFLHDGVCVLTNVKHKDCVKLAPGESYWDWMEYQKGQAAKTERLEGLLREEVNKRYEQMVSMAEGIGKDADIGLNTLARTAKPE